MRYEGLILSVDISPEEIFNNFLEKYLSETEKREKQEKEKKWWDDLAIEIEAMSVLNRYNESKANEKPVDTLSTELNRFKMIVKLKNGGYLDEIGRYPIGYLGKSDKNLLGDSEEIQGTESEETSIE